MIAVPKCPVEQYASDVVDGRIVAGRFVRLACERHLRDLVDGPGRGLKWDREASDDAIEFFSFLRLPLDGELDGQPFTLEPFQKFIVGSLFGWKGADGYRRFRTAYIEIGKGNGKSPMAAGIGLKGMVADDEAAAEIYAAATTQKQAGVLFRDAVMMVNASPALRERLQVHVGNIAFEDKGSFFRPVSSEKRGLDGPRPHMGLIDEIHEHPDAVVVDKIRAGTKGRRQALILEITNSGYDRTSVCWHHHEFSSKVLEGFVENDAWFAYVCCLDVCGQHRAEGQTQPIDGCKQCDNWRDESVWMKANPGMGAILPVKYLREQVAEAVDMPTKENIVKRLNFCMWTEAVTHAIPMDRWDACKSDFTADSFKGREVFVGLDIGATSDFTALELVFPHNDPTPVEIPADPENPDSEQVTFIRRSFSVLSYFWLPAIPPKRDGRLDSVISGWRQQGLIRTTPGNTVDYDIVLAEMLSILKPFRVVKIAFDRGFQGGQMGTNLMKHFGDKVEQFPQGVISMNAPFRELVELVKVGRLHHDGHPVLRWMASNTAAETRGGLSKPSKDKSTEKIDGITALTMALGMAFCNVRPVSVYTKRGLRVI